MRLAILCIVCGLIVGCQKPASGRQTDRQRTDAQYAGWAKSQPRPSRNIIKQVESSLERQPCVGHLSQWSRFYAYDYLPEKTVDTGIVDFHLEQDGSHGVHITAPDSWVALDDRPIRMAEGDYDVRERRIRFAFCRNNMGPRQPSDIFERSHYFEDLRRRRSADRSREAP